MNNYYIPQKGSAHGDKLRKKNLFLNTVGARGFEPPATPASPLTRPDGAR